MRIIAIKRLKEFWESGYADSEQPLKVWYQIFRQGSFDNPNKIKSLFSSCSFVGNNRVVFNISGNKYRLVIHIRYDLQIVYIRFIGTHAQYDKINVGEV
ncbi:MAG: addiction module toxin RelE [Rickettsiales bacterium]|nr:MAG: addiction module toxin RelE [Rickettsiales bacterium]